MGDKLLGIKFLITTFIGAGGSLWAAETGATNIAVGTTLAVVVGFAGLLIQQVFKSQHAVWEIVKDKDSTIGEKDEEIARKNEELRFVTWEREQARFRANERTDPGPYIKLKED